jgi:FkbM family methyltransferase
MLLNWIRENFHPLLYLRKNSAAFRWVTRNIRITVPVHIKDIDHSVYIDLLRNPRMIADADGYERDQINLMISLIRQKNLRRMFDIGANFGVYAFAFAANAKDGRVIAFEPDSISCKLFEKTNARIPQRNIVLERKAVTETCGTATFLVDDMSGATSSLGLEGQTFSEQGYKYAGRATVLTASIDDTSSRQFPPDFIKIDVYGSELDVLKGAHDTLSSARPILQIEIDTDSSKDNVQKFLKEFDYVLVPVIKPSYLGYHKNTDIQTIS